MRQYPLVTHQFYHVFNRGIAKLPTFLDDSDYREAKFGLRYYRSVAQPMRLSHLKRLPLPDQRHLLEQLDGELRIARLVAFSLMPNHFHLIVEQLVDGGITKFIHNWLASYGHFFNVRHERTGAVFQAGFKAVPIHTTDQLVHVSRYVHINHTVAGLMSIDELTRSPRTSLPEYLVEPELVEPSIILDQFSSPDAYRRFVEDRIEYGKSLEVIKHLLLE